MENLLHYEEIGEMTARPRGGQEVENSMHYEEIEEMGSPTKGGSGSEEFDAL